MKKQSLNNLGLKKQTITKLQLTKIRGGDFKNETTNGATKGTNCEDITQ